MFAMDHLPLWVLGAATLALFVRIQTQLAPLRPHYVRLQLAATPDSFERILQSWGPDGVTRYRSLFPSDLLFIVYYSVFGYLLAIEPHLLRWLEPDDVRRLAYVLPAAGLCDACEVALRLRLTSPRTSRTPVLYPFAAGCTVIKWLLFLAYTLIVLIKLR